MPESSDRPLRVAVIGLGVARFLDPVLPHRDVWWAARAEVARHWIATHPAA